MAIRCGIVGLPNVGKSTLFNALTRAEIAAENYPFCTIDPNIGVVPVPDPRLAVLAAIAKPQKVIPTTVEFVDIAGLVEGASKGEGLGNKFLGNIRETDAITHVVRCFHDDDVVHVAGRVDPLSDIATIETELALADLDSVDSALTKAQKVAKTGEKSAKRRVEMLERFKLQLDAGDPIRGLDLEVDERALLKEMPLLTSKPTLFIANVDEGDSEDNDMVEAVRDHAERTGAEMVVVCAAIEAEISQLEDADRAEFLTDLGLAEPGLDRVIRGAYRLLGLLTYFTVGEKEVRAWTVRDGSTAPQAAGVIHTDFEKGFIRAETIAYEDFVACAGEAKAREAGKLRLEGKDYVVQEGDVLHFRFNV